MANGRKAVTFFPIQAYGDQPTAQPDELITYPQRAFSGDKANLGTQTGAFYAYSSFPSDETGLILKGRYKINETETKETSYPVALKQTDAQGNGSFIEINPNHRYTIAITQADEYKLQTNIITSDWADDESIDECNPGETDATLSVSISDGFKNKSQWDAATRTVNMSLEAGSSAGVSVSTNSAILVSKRYSGKDQSYDWLNVSAPTVAQTKAFSAFGYQYTLSLKNGNTFAIGITSISGVEVAIDFDGGSEWLTHNGETYVQTASAAAPVLSNAGEQASVNSAPDGQIAGIESMNLYAGNKKNTITFSLDNSKLSGGKTATVTLKNKTGGKIISLPLRHNGWIRLMLVGRLLLSHSLRSILRILR